MWRVCLYWRNELQSEHDFETKEEAIKFFEFKMATFKLASGPWWSASYPVEL